MALTRQMIAPYHTKFNSNLFLVILCMKYNKINITIYYFRNYRTDVD